MALYMLNTTINLCEICLTTVITDCRKKKKVAINYMRFLDKCLHLKPRLIINVFLRP